MVKTNWQDPRSTEIRSTHISGLQEAVGKIEESIGIQTVMGTGISLTEVFISNEDRCRIYQAPEGKRNWLSSPTPVIKKNGITIADDFEIDYGGGAIIFTTPILETDVLTADVSYTTKITGKQLSSEDYSLPEKQKLAGIDYNANNYTHPDSHPASMILLEDESSVEDKIDAIIENINEHESDYTMQIPWGGTTTNSGNAYSIANPVITSLNIGMAVSFKCNADATGAVTLNWAGTGDKSVLKSNGTPVTNWKNGGVYTVRFDGTNFCSQGEGGEYGTATPNKVLKGYTIGTENGLEIGTLDIPEEAWFNPHNKWYKCTAHPTTSGADAIKGTMGCVCDNKLYLFSFFITSPSNYWGWNVYDPTTNIWTKDYTYTGVTPSYSTYICGVFNHIIYLKIADSATTSTTDKIYAYDTISKTMSSFTIKTLETHDASSRWIMTDENTFYSIGGYTTKLTYSYNRITDTITLKASCPVYLSNPSCVYNPTNNTIYVVGNKSTVSTDPTPLYAYDCSANTWIPKTDYVTDPRYNLSIILKDANTLLIGGGMNTTDTYYNSFKYYDITTNSYTITPYAPINKQVGSFGIINNKVYWFGGWTSSGGYDNTYVYFY